MEFGDFNDHVEILSDLIRGKKMPEILYTYDSDGDLKKDPGRLIENFFEFLIHSSDFLIQFSDFLIQLSDN